MIKSPSSSNSPKSQIPTKWLAVIVFALVVYGLAQPFANRKFGWKLPSIASVLGFEDAGKKPVDETTGASSQDKDGTEQTTKNSADNRSKSKSNSKSSSNGSELPSAADLERDLLEQPDRTEANGVSDLTSDRQPNKKTSNDESTSKSAASKSADKSTNKSGSGNSSSSKTDKAEASDDDLLYGLLKLTGRDEYVSPAGLRYTRGSEEGHRLKHLERHLEDQPDRPGKHGVFDGDMPQVLRWLDEAYTRGKSGAKGTSKHEEDGRLVYEVSFGKPIGFIGGRDGARQKNPDAKRLRMVVDGDRLITAFPF